MQKQDIKQLIKFVAEITKALKAIYAILELLVSWLS